MRNILRFNKNFSIKQFQNKNQFTGLFSQKLSYKFSTDVFEEPKLDNETNINCDFTYLKKTLDIDNKNSDIHQFSNNKYSNSIIYSSQSPLPGLLKYEQKLTKLGLLQSLAISSYIFTDFTLFGGAFNSLIFAWPAYSTYFLLRRQYKRRSQLKNVVANKIQLNNNKESIKIFLENGKTIESYIKDVKYIGLYIIYTNLFFSGRFKSQVIENRTHENTSGKDIHHVIRFSVIDKNDPQKGEQSLRLYIYGTDFDGNKFFNIENTTLITKLLQGDTQFIKSLEKVKPIIDDKNTENSIIDDEDAYDFNEDKEDVISPAKEFLVELQWTCNFNLIMSTVFILLGYQVINYAGEKLVNNQELEEEKQK